LYQKNIKTTRNIVKIGVKMVEETKEQLELEAEIKAQAQKFLKYLN
jgi:hypothetical protein